MTTTLILKKENEPDQCDVFQTMERNFRAHSGVASTLQRLLTEEAEQSSAASNQPQPIQEPDENMAESQEETSEEVNTKPSEGRPYQYNIRKPYPEIPSIFEMGRVFDPEFDQISLVQQFKSQLYTVLGASLYTHKSFLMWADKSMRSFDSTFNLFRVKTHRQYYAGPLKEREFHYSFFSDFKEKEENSNNFTEDNVNLGLSTALQTRKLNQLLEKDQEELKKYGLEVEVKRWQRNDSRPVLCLTLNHELVRTRDVRRRLENFLDLDPRERLLEEEDLPSDSN